MKLVGLKANTDYWTSNPTFYKESVVLLLDNFEKIINYN